MLLYHRWTTTWSSKTEIIENRLNRIFFVFCFAQGVIVTRARNASVDIKPLGKDNLWYLIETNYDNWKKPPIFDDRLTPCIKCMQTKGKDQVTFESLFNVFSSRPMLNKVRKKNIL